MIKQTDKRRKRIQEEAKFDLKNKYDNNIALYLHSLEDDLKFLEETNSNFEITAFPTSDTETKINYIKQLCKNSNPTIICISGKARSGKDTSSSMLYDELVSRDKRVLVCHYADLLKYICRTFLGWDGKKDDAGRTLLQRIGTDVVRNQEENFWVDFLIKIVKFFKTRWDYILIPDTRFPNEIERWKEEGFNVLHIRVIRENSDSPLSAEQQNHASETMLDNYPTNYVINNDKDLEALKYNVQNCCDNCILKI